jgi:GNAT superfamily N-acetyltransferase
MEGLRVDPARQNLGAGKAITRGVLDLAARAGATRVGLATYMTDSPSIHIIKSHGFSRVASFVYLEAKVDAAVRRQAEPSDLVTDVPSAEAIGFIRHSAFLMVARDHFPHGWKFYPFALDAETVLSRMKYVLGVLRDGRLSALLCSGHPLRGQGEFTIDFLDGDPTDMAVLIRHALHLAHDSATVETMVPKWGEGQVAALDVLKNLGFQAWNAWEEDLFVYEQNLQAEIANRKSKIRNDA